jgi:hypothetical protein
MLVPQGDLMVDCYTVGCLDGGGDGLLLCEGSKWPNLSNTMVMENEMVRVIMS